jgi:hypothetical protein
MLRNRSLISIREHGHAKINRFASFELRCPSNHCLGGFVDVKRKAFFPKPPVVLGLGGP